MSISPALKLPTSYIAKEEYQWGEKDTRLEGNLNGLRHVDCTIGKVNKARFFKYDDKGNILKEKQYGTVTSLEKPDVTIRNYALIENGADCYVKECTYTKDNLNLLTQEKETNGKTINYAYHPESNAIITKLVKDGDKNIISREINTYDRNLFLIKKIVDDGISDDVNNLSRVISRKITYYEPRTRDCPQTKGSSIFEIILAAFRLKFQGLYTMSILPLKF